MISTPYDHIAKQFAAQRTALFPKEKDYLDLLLGPLASPGTILDLGCGAGHPIASHIASRGHRVVGVDGSEAMLTLARQRLPEHRWIHEMMERVEFEETFDAVVCWDSLFHLPRGHYQPIMAKIHRWLRPGGRVMVSSGYLVDEKEGGFTDTMFDHEFFYDSLPPGQMVSMMEQIGFRILIAEVCDQPDGGRNKGKWATIAAKK